VTSTVKCAVFDLDGTLVNTIRDLARSVDYTMEQCGVAPKWSEDDYISFVGDGIPALVDRAFEHKLTKDELDKALDFFAAKYKIIQNDNTYIYDGMKDELDALKNRGLKLAVVSNKPQKNAVLMVEKLFGSGYFDVICGARDDLPRKPDPSGTLEILSSLGIDAGEAIYFGDSDTDVRTAHNAGVTAVGCTWGFRSREIIASANPEYIIDSPRDISKLF
jgi:phosphoglycolate phosphatase